ncbi:MAG: rhodanese-related sulfurtransferase [Hyphomicrobium sp.]|nr:rhodanese-related sulfurtransferase [Hyphomicrobium sp.]
MIASARFELRVCSALAEKKLPVSATIAAFYKFVRIDDADALAASLTEHCTSLGIKGTILLAREGINGTIAGPAGAVADIFATLRRDIRFADLVVKWSTAPGAPFQRLKVKVKPEIVTFGAPDEADPTRRVGTYVEPARWNELISREEVVVIDTRNAYEVSVGTFKGARHPGTRSFVEFKRYAETELDPSRHPQVAMFCTGGIRCEKASAYLLSLGFPEVYHLEGGILRYLEEIPPEDSLWRGECFVFDERVAVRHGVAVGTHALCADCGFPISADDGAKCPACARLTAGR